MIIDKAGPSGNAYAILAATTRILRKQGLTSEEIEAIMGEMTAGDYDNLCEVAESATNGELSFY